MDCLNKTHRKRYRFAVGEDSVPLIIEAISDYQDTIYESIC